jgi:hypothetical protein
MEIKELDQNHDKNNAIPFDVNKNFIAIAMTSMVDG